MRICNNAIIFSITRSRVECIEISFERIESKDLSLYQIIIIVMSFDFQLLNIYI